MVTPFLDISIPFKKKNSKRRNEEFTLCTEKIFTKTAKQKKIKLIIKRVLN